MDALGCAAARVTGGNGHFVSGYRKPSDRVEARDDRGGIRSDGNDQPLRPKVPGWDVSLNSDGAAVEP